MPQSLKDRSNSGQKKKDKRTNNDLQQNITHKINDRVTRTPLKTGGDLMCSGKVQFLLH
jgi:hypothetical protein